LVEVGEVAAGFCFVLEDSGEVEEGDDRGVGVDLGGSAVGCGIEAQF
jgi:hypothetical protein